jgi:hypothetical protein
LPGKNAPCTLCRALGQNAHGKGCVVRILAFGKARESGSDIGNDHSGDECSAAARSFQKSKGKMSKDQQKFDAC